MSPKIRVQSSPSGCWWVMRGDYLIHVYSPHMWRQAYVAAFQEAIYQNLGVVRIETA